MPDRQVMRNTIGAKNLSDFMRENHDFASLEDEQLQSLGRQLYRVSQRTELVSYQEDVTSLHEFEKAFAPIRNAINRISRLSASDKEVDTLIVKKLEGLSVEDELSDYVSISAWLKNSERIYTVLSSLEKNNQFPQSEDHYAQIVRGSSGNWSWKTELMGRKVPALYWRYYPDGRVGGHGGLNNHLSGPLYAFVSEFMKCLGFNDVTPEAIRAAMRTTSNGEKP